MGGFPIMNHSPAFNYSGPPTVARPDAPRHFKTDDLLSFGRSRIHYPASQHGRKVSLGALPINRGRRFPTPLFPPTPFHIAAAPFLTEN